MTQTNTNHELLLRLGNIQLLVSWTGEGVHRRPVTQIGKILPEEVLKQNPKAANEWSMEDLSALRTLCRQATENMSVRQSVDFAAQLPREVPQKKAGKKANKKAAKKTRGRSR